MSDITEAIERYRPDVMRERTLAQRAAIGVVLAPMLLLFACTGGAPAPSGTSDQDADAVLHDARLDDGESLGRLSELYDTDAGARVSANALSGGAQGDLLWAATYVYAGSGSDPSLLEPLLSDPDPTIRTLAAGAS